MRFVSLAAVVALAGCLHGPVSTYPDGGQLVCDQGETCGPGTYCFQGFCVAIADAGSPPADAGDAGPSDGGPGDAGDAGHPDAACVPTCQGKPCGNDDGCGSICIAGGNPSGCTPATFSIQKGAVSGGASAASSTGVQLRGTLGPASESNDSNYRIHAGRVGP